MAGRLYETFDFDLENEVTKLIAVRVIDGVMHVVSIYHIGELTKKVETTFATAGTPAFERLQFTLWIHFDWIPIRWLPFFTIPLRREF